MEGLHGLAMDGVANWLPARRVQTTVFPQSYGLGETWDVEVLRSLGEVASTEMRYVWHHPDYRLGGLILFSPNADLGRDPRWGRTEECFGEDPWLVGALSVALIRGLHGDHPVYWKATSLMKHFLANSHEKDRERTSSDFDERLWREYYSVGFRMGIEDAGCRAYMAAYNAYNGIPCHAHPMHKEIAEAEWGQDGMISTDGGGCRLLFRAHKYVKSLSASAATIIKAGIGRFLDRFRRATLIALRKGMLTEGDLDQVLRKTFRLAIKLGVLDPEGLNPYEEIANGPEPWLSKDHQERALEATRKSIVLLKNERNILPVDRTKLKKIAVVGEKSAQVFIDWYSGMSPYQISPLDGIREKVGDAVEVLHALTGDEAVAAARDADIAIVVVGNDPVGDLGFGKVSRPSYGKEEADRESLDLEEEDLIREVYAANPNTVVVLVSSFPYAINWSQAHVPGIVHMAHGSQEQGHALADVLFGDYNPAGRLTQTWVRSIDDLPPMLDYDLRNGRTYMYFEGEPLYPFGFGLSYTEFAYRTLRVEPSELDSGQELSATVEIQNVGTRDGEEVVQLYVSYPDSKVYRPRKQLRAFKRVAVKAGETRSVSLRVAAKDLSYWDADQHSWRLEPGPIVVQVGPSSGTLPLSRTISALSVRKK
jgi:beta-glucosidase